MTWTQRCMTWSRAPHLARHVLMVHASACSPTGECALSWPEIVRLTGIPQKTAQRAFAVLVSIGELELIKEHNGRGKVDVYRINVCRPELRNKGGHTDQSSDDKGWSECTGKGGLKVVTVTSLSDSDLYKNARAHEEQPEDVIAPQGNTPHHSHDDESPFVADE
jgi:hypothetical protein